MNFDPRNWSLSTQLVASVTMLLVLVAATLVYVFPKEMHRSSTEWLDSRADGVVVALEKAVEPGFEFEDGEHIGGIFEELSGPLGMTYASVYLSDGTLLVSTLPKAPATIDVVVPDGLVKEFDNDQLHVTKAMKTSRGTKGVLAIGLSLDELKLQRQENTRFVVLLSLVVVAFGFIVSAALGLFLAAPIRQMSDVARHIAHGDLIKAENGLRATRMAAASGVVESRSEVGQLLGSFSIMVASLKETVTTLRESAVALSQAGQNLSGSAAAQSETITRQAAALQETQVTVQEIKQTSQLATQKAEAVLGAAEEADEIGRSGELAIEQSLGGLADIRGQVDEITVKINELNERTVQIGGITQTVKDLADQSNMLALNATIEAVRSGEHGKAFAVVAREIRSLADQSIQATNRVREILDDITQAMGDAVRITEVGSARIESGLIQLNESGENLQKLSEIVKENSAAVRQIAAAVNQQNAGIAQIVNALSDLSEMMDETVRRLDDTNQAAEVLGGISRDVAAVVERYEV